MELLFVSVRFLSSHAPAVVACMVVYMIVGMLWYGPLFGKQWAKANNLPMPKKGEVKFSQMAEPMVTSLITAALQASVLGGVFAYLHPTTIVDAKLIATVLWLPFLAGTTLTNYAWSMKSVSLRLIDIGYSLVTINIFAVILLYLG